MNENYAQPSLPEGAEADIIKGLYRVSTHGKANAANDVRLVGAGAILPQVMEAAQQLDADWGVATEVRSATSFSGLARDAPKVERRIRLNRLALLETSHVAGSLGGNAPIVAATDYVRAYSQLIASYVDAPFAAMGTRSDTRVLRCAVSSRPIATVS